MPPSPAVRFAVPEGTTVCMDSRSLHRGSANTAPLPRPVFYFSFLSRQGSEPLGSTFTLRDKYEDSNTLIQSMDPAFEPNEKGRKGRFCFGTLNAPKGNLRNIYPFPMCSGFKFLPKKE